MATATKAKPKKAKAKKGTIHVAILLDESGSMAHNRRAVIDGTNEFIGSLQGEKNSERTKLTLATFDAAAGRERTRILRNAEKLNDAKQITEADYCPQGMTPLNDAIADTVQAIEAKSKKNDKALLVIYTDGYENASREYDKAAIKALLERKQDEDSWTVIYLGANVDVQAEKQAYGTGVAATTTSSPAGVRSTMRSAANVGVGYLADSGVMPQAKAQSMLGSEIPEHDGGQTSGRVKADPSSTAKPAPKGRTTSSVNSDEARNVLRNS